MTAPGFAARILKVRPDEERVALRVFSMMVVLWTGFTVGANAVESLLFTRYGPSVLPVLFVTLGLITFAVMAAVGAALSGARRPRRLLLRAPLGMAVLVAGMRVALLTGERGVYPVLWVAMMVLWVLGGVTSWGVAASVHDTRQAKRLFPLYGAGLIVGTAVGGLATGPVAARLGVESLLFLWMAGLLGGWALATSAVRAAASREAARRRSRPRLSEGVRSLWSSSLLRWMAASMVLFAVLYNAVAFLFATAVTRRFPDAEALAGFLGAFTAVACAVGLAVSLLISNRLFARFGVPVMVAAFAAIYAAGFGVLSATMAFAVVVGFRFAQVVWFNAVWASAWQSMLNVVPPGRRDRTRAAMDGVALQGGMILAGLVLLLARRLPARAVALLGLGAAVGAVAATMRARAAYRGAVVEALRAGNPDVFVSEEEPFGGVRTDRAALDVVLSGAADPDPATRRVSMEILAETAHREAGPVLRRGLEDQEPHVRAAALRGIARIDAGRAVISAGALLEDPHAVVRREAVALASPVDLDGRLKDADPGIRALAAARVGDHLGQEVLRELLASRSPDARRAAVEALPPGSEEARAAAIDPDASVRRAAVRSMAGARRPDPSSLIAMLGDPEPEVRMMVIGSLVEMGDAAVPGLRQAVDRPHLEVGAMLALTRLGRADPDRMEAFRSARTGRAVHLARLQQALSSSSSEAIALLVHGLRHRSVEHAVAAIQVAGRTRDPEAIRMAVQALDASDPNRRADALETLEAVGDPVVVRPLLAAWEGSGPRMAPSQAVAELLDDPDPWLRGAATHVARGFPALHPRLRVLASDDVDTLVREAATAALEEEPVEALPTLPLVERMVCLRRVPLFRDLAPADLKHVAEVVTEHAYGHGEVIAEEGEPGEEMYVVVSGDISVRVSSSNGPAEVARRGRGETVGEMAVVSREPRMASLVAEGEVRLLVLDRPRFQRILRDRPDASLAVMAVLSQRLREATGPGPA